MRVKTQGFSQNLIFYFVVNKSEFDYIRERADLAHTVNVMVDLGLTYSQTKNPDGTYQYRIEPDINFLCNFNGMLDVNISQVTSISSEFFFFFSIIFSKSTNK